MPVALLVLFPNSSLHRQELLPIYILQLPDPFLGQDTFNTSAEDLQDLADLCIQIVDTISLGQSDEPRT